MAFYGLLHLIEYLKKAKYVTLDGLQLPSIGRKRFWVNMGTLRPDFADTTLSHPFVFVCITASYSHSLVLHTACWNM